MLPLREVEKLIREIPYQRINDSPTVKRYTEWRLFESYLLMPESVYSENLPSPLRRIRPLIELRGRLDTNISKTESSLLSIKRLWNRSPNKLPEVKLEALHSLRWFAGAELRVKPKAQVPSLLVILSAGGRGYVGHHLKIDVGERTKATVVLLDYLGNEKGLKTFIVEGFLGEGSELTLYPVTIHKWGAPSFSVRTFILSNNSKLIIKAVTGGGVMTHEKYNIVLRGENSEALLISSAITKDGCRLDLITNMFHEAPETFSRVRVRGGVKGDSLLVHRGVSRVLNNAVESDTEIESRVTILGDSGKGYSIPMLELESGRVKNAKHSASVIKIDNLTEFYLMSRGLSRSDIIGLVMRGIITYSGALDTVLPGSELMKITG